MKHYTLLIILLFSLVSTTWASDIKGDINEDGSLSMDDASLLANIMIGNETTSLSLKKLDINGDGVLSITDLTKLIDMILNKKDGGVDTSIEGWDESDEDYGGVVNAPTRPITRSGNGERLYLEEILLQPGMQVEIPVYMYDYENINGFFTKIVLPAGFEYQTIDTDYAKLYRKDDSHLLLTNLNGRELSVLAYSTKNAVFPQNQSIFFSFKIEASEIENDYGIKLCSTELSDTDFDPIRQEDEVRNIALVQKLDFAKNWNWLSTYLNGDLAVVDWFGNGLIRILNQTQESILDEKYGPVGGIKNLEKGVGYKARFDKDAEVELSGTLHNLTESPIVVKKGWNWISYPYYIDGKVGDVIVNAEDGDYIISQRGFSEYADGYWEGVLEVLASGCGYLYKSASEKTLEFDFSKTSAPISYLPSNISPQISPEVDVHKYPNTMNVTARLYDEGGAEISDDDYVIYTLYEDELRGVGQKVNDNYYITVYGEESVEIRVLIKCLASGITYQANESLTFVSDVIGARNNPYAIVLGKQISNIDEIMAESPQPVYRIDGTVVITKNIENLPKGLYIVGGKKVVK